MPVPTARTDLSIIASNNSPAGSEVIAEASGPDDYIRAHAALIRENYDDIVGLQTLAVSVKDYGAIGNGVADDTDAVAAAFAAAPTGALVVFPNGTYKLTSVNVSGKAVSLHGYGATINSSSASGAFYKTDHGNKLRVEGFTFVCSGSGRAVNHQSTETTTAYDELEVVNCTFTMGSGVYGIYCVGTREARISRCTFYNSSSGCGIYFSKAVAPFVSNCLFIGGGYAGKAVDYPGTGTAYDAGLVLRDCEIMGWEYGLHVVGCDWLVVNGCTIDYNTNSIILTAQDGANIANNYIGSVGANPALVMSSDAGITPTFCHKIVVQNNTFTGHYEGGNTYDCILVAGTTDPDEIQISNNNIHFYTRYGISFDMGGQRLTIKENSFGPRSTFGVAPIYNTATGGDGGVIVKDNYFTGNTTITAMNLSAACVNVNGNIGCTLNVASQVVVPNGADTATFAHGATGFTPATTDVFICCVNKAAAVAQPYVQSIDATNCIINTVNVASGNAGVAYRISRYKA
jgi:hypothetical protein